MYEITIEDHKVVVAAGGAAGGAEWKLYVDSDLRDTCYVPESPFRMAWTTILRASIVCRDGQKRGVEYQMSVGFFSKNFRFLFAGNEIKKW